MTKRRQTVRRLAAATLVAAAAAAPAPKAHAQTAADAACGSLLQLLYFMPPPNSSRLFGLDVLMDTDLSVGPAPPLAGPEAPVHIGPEVRLSLGIPGSGFELFLDGAWMVPGLGDGGALRAGLGTRWGWSLGRGADLYAVLSDGLWAGANPPAIGGLNVTMEIRFGFGFRLPIRRLGNFMLELDGSSRGIVGAGGAPLLGFRIGWSWGSAIQPRMPGPPGQ